jgi:hypothetical protein
MDPENEQLIDEVIDEDVEDITEETPDDTDWKALAQKNAGIAKRLQTKLKKANEPKEEPKAKKDEAAPKADGLDETQLDYLDLKGFTEAEDIKIIEQVVRKTGITVREALQDEYVIAKLEALKEKRDVRGATPSGTKRSSPTGDTLSQAIAKYERDGTLPEDFKMRSDVVNALVDKKNSNKPSWA